MIAEGHAVCSSTVAASRTEHRATAPEQARQSQKQRTPGADSSPACGSGTSTCAGSSSRITRRTKATAHSWRRRPSAPSASGRSWRTLFVEERKKRACSMFPRCPVRSRRTRPDTSTARTKSSSASRRKRRSSAPSCPMAVCAWCSIRSRPTVTSRTRRSSRRSPSIARRTTRACSTPTRPTSAPAAVRTS